MRKFAFAAIAVVGLFASTSTARAEDVDNPEYELWAKFKAGSYVVQKMESEAAGNKTNMEYTYTLKEITKAKAVVETKGVMTMAGNKMDIPASSREIPAKVKKTDPVKSDAPKAKEGDEEVEVGGKKIKCHWTETETESSGTKSKSKVWTSKEIPGGMAKMESTSDSAQMKSHTKMWADKWESK